MGGRAHLDLLERTSSRVNTRTFGTIPAREQLPEGRCFDLFHGGKQPLSAWTAAVAEQFLRISCSRQCARQLILEQYAIDSAERTGFGQFRVIVVRDSPLCCDDRHVQLISDCGKQWVAYPLLVDSSKELDTGMTKC